MKTLLFFFSLIFSLPLSAQDSTLTTLVHKYFPSMTVENYLTHKIIALYHIQTKIPEELWGMVESSDDGDTSLQKALVVYVDNQENFSKLVLSCQKYGEKFAATEFLIEYDVATVLREIFSRHFTAEFVAQIETIRIREE